MDRRLAEPGGPAAGLRRGCAGVAGRGEVNGHLQSPPVATGGLFQYSHPSTRGAIAVTPKEVLALVREREVRAVDLRFMDFPGLWQHFTIPADKLEEATFEDGLGFDGSSIRGWRQINESDVLVLPNSDTAFIDPFRKEVTLTLICNILAPLTKENYARDPRNIALKAVRSLEASGVADGAEVGAEIEFFLFDDVRYDQTAHAGYYYV